jgi:hypothetical protein
MIRFLFEGVRHACRLTVCVCVFCVILKPLFCRRTFDALSRTYVICYLAPCFNGERRTRDRGEKGIKGGKKVAENKGEKGMIPRGISNGFSYNRKTFAAVNI